MKEYIVKTDFITERDEVVSPETVGELIRCKDCKYWNGEGYFCDYDMIAFENDFCSQAKPKEGPEE